MPIAKKEAEFVEPTVPTEPEIVEVKRETPSAEPVKQDLPEKVADQTFEPQSYVWLADGSVVRAYDADLPAGGGTGTPHGFWQRGDKVYQVVGVYPVESVVEGK